MKQFVQTLSGPRAQGGRVPSGVASPSGS